MPHPTSRFRIRPFYLGLAAFALATVFYVQFVVPVPGDPGGRRGEARARSDVQALLVALDAFAREHGGVYPAALDELTVRDGKGLRFLDEPEVPRDPWKRPYVYEPPSKEHLGPRVCSYGPDGRPGGGDDVTSTATQTSR